MQPKRLVLWLVALVVVVGAYKIVSDDFRERARSIAAQQDPPASRPATQPAGSMLTIPLADGSLDEKHFPPAHVRLVSHEPPLILEVSSDEGAKTLTPNYKGNYYYLKMELTSASEAELNQAEWTYKAPSADVQEGTDGIFLDGGRRKLLPYDVTARITRSGNEVSIELEGTFLYRIQEGSVFRQEAHVKGTLTAPLELKRR